MKKQNLVASLALAGALSASAPMIVAISGLVLTTLPAQAGMQVNGAAGGDAAVWFDGTCSYWAKNLGGRKIRVHLGAFSAIVNPGESFQFTGFGGCLTGFIGDTWAEYV